MEKRMQKFIEWLADSGWGYELIDAAQTVVAALLAGGFVLLCFAELVAAGFLLFAALCWSPWWLLCYIPLLVLVIITVAVKNKIMDS